MPSKPKVIFLGAFRKAAADGTIGGQAFACNSLVDSPLSEEVEWLLIDSTQQSQPPPGFLVRLYFAIRRSCQAVWWLVTKRIQATLIFTRYEFSSFLEKGMIAIAARLMGSRAIISIRSEVRSFGHERWTDFFRKVVARSCHSIICQSDHSASELVARLGLPAAKLEIIPNWINPEIYRVSNRRLPASPFCFLFMGWLETYKGVHHLIDAAAELKRAGYDFRIEICGGGSEKERLLGQVEELGVLEEVRFSGWVSGEEKAAAFANNDILVLPSYSEGMPNSVLEAMAAGMAVIATPVGGTSTLIRSQDQGILVEVGKIEPLVAAMKKLMDEPGLGQTMGHNNVKIVEQDHHIQSVWPRVAAALGVLPAENEYRSHVDAGERN